MVDSGAWRIEHAVELRLYTYYGSASDASAYYGPAYCGSAYYGSAYYGAAYYGSAYYGSAHYRSADYGSAHYGSAYYYGYTLVYSFQDSMISGARYLVRGVAKVLRGAATVLRGVAKGCGLGRAVPARGHVLGEEACVILLGVGDTR